MTLITQIEEDVKQATLARDSDRRDALRLILASLRSAEKDLQRPLSDDEELQVLQRERKRRIEAAEAFHAAGRDEQAAKEEGELAILEEFMPAPLTEEELESIVDDAIAENGATSLQDLTLRQRPLQILLGRTQAGEDQAQRIAALDVSSEHRLLHVGFELRDQAHSGFPKTCQWRWKTVCPALGPTLTTTR